MENLLSTNYPRWLVTVVHSLHRLKTGGHLTESELSSRSLDAVRFPQCGWSVVHPLALLCIDLIQVSSFASALAHCFGHSCVWSSPVAKKSRALLPALIPLISLKVICYTRSSQIFKQQKSHPRAGKGQISILPLPGRFL